MAALEVRGNRFRVVFRFQGKTWKKTLKTKSEKTAEHLRTSVDELLGLVDRGVVQVPEGVDIPDFFASGGRVTRRVALPPKTLGLAVLMDQFFASLPDDSHADTTLDGMKRHQRHLVRILGEEFNVMKLAEADLQRFVTERSREKGTRGAKVKVETILKALRTLRRVWYWAGRRGLVPQMKFPMRDLQLPKEEERGVFMTASDIRKKIAGGGLSEIEEAELWELLFLTTAEIEEVLAVVKQNARHAFIYPMFVFIAHTGARRSEALRSQVSDVDFEAGVITLRERKRSRIKKTTRRVPMSARLSAVMREWLTEEHPGGPWTFTLGTKKLKGTKVRSEPVMLTRNEAHDHLQRSLAGSNWSVVRGWHVFRHSFISALAAKGVDQRIIDEIVGHQSEEQRRRYRHLLPSQKASALASVFG